MLTHFTDELQILFKLSQKPIHKKSTKQGQNVMSAALRPKNINWSFFKQHQHFKM